MTSYTSHKVQKEFLVCFLFEKTTYMIASASSENPGGMRAKRARTQSLSPPALPTRTRDPRGGETWVHPGLPFTQSSTTQLNWQKFLGQSYNHSEMKNQMLSINNSGNWNNNYYLTYQINALPQRAKSEKFRFSVSLKRMMSKILSLELMNNLCWEKKSPINNFRTITPYLNVKTTQLMWETVDSGRVPI